MCDEKENGPGRAEAVIAPLVDLDLDRPLVLLDRFL